MMPASERKIDEKKTLDLSKNFLLSPWENSFSWCNIYDLKNFVNDLWAVYEIILLQNPRWLRLWNVVDSDE